MTEKTIASNLTSTEEHYYPRTSRTPDAVDIHVGSRIRLRRTIFPMSQAKLAQKMNLTFQQIQKYENGHGRIVAGRLFQVSKILEVPVGYFFASEGGQDIWPAIDEPEDDRRLRAFMNSARGLKLCRAYLNIALPSQRKMVVSVMETLGAGEENS